MRVGFHSRAESVDTIHRVIGWLKSVTVIGLLIPLSQGTPMAAVREAPLGGFIIEHQLTLPETPEAIYDAVTGDISGWWDHTFSDTPHALYIEPRPGGGFYELFDESGNGVLHGTVHFAERGKILRFTGPLGFSGTAVDFVCTYQMEAAGDSTLFKLTVSVAGLIDENVAKSVDQVWHHFLFDRLKPYITSGQHRASRKAIPPDK